MGSMSRIYYQIEIRWLEWVTFSLHRKTVYLVHDAFLQAWTVRAALAWVGTTFHVYGKRRARDGHVVVEYVNGVAALFEGRVADTVSAIALGDNELLGLPSAGVVYGARHYAVVSLRLGDRPRVYRELRLLIHIQTWKAGQ